MHETLSLDDVRRSMLEHLMRASGIERLQPMSASHWNWSANGVQRAQQLAQDMHDWIDEHMRLIGNKFNQLNPATKLPEEVLCAIFRH